MENPEPFYDSSSFKCRYGMGMMKAASIGDTDCMDGGLERASIQNMMQSLWSLNTEERFG